MPSARDRPPTPDGPTPVPVPEARRKLSGLFQRLRAEFDRKGSEIGRPTVTNRQIAELAHRSSLGPRVKGQPTEDLPRKPSDAQMSGALTDFATVEFVAAVRDLVIPSSVLAFHIVRGLDGPQEAALRASKLCEQARTERDQRRADRSADPEPETEPQSPSGRQLRAVVDAILAHLISPSKRGPRGKLSDAVEIALGQAIARFAAGNGKVSLAWPLLDPDGFLTAPEIAAILARALSGGDLEGAPLLGQEWARAFLDRTRATELTADAEDLLSFLREEAQKLPGLAAPDAAPRLDAVTQQELRQQLAEARELLAGLDRVSAFDIGRPARSLPPQLRSFLRYQIPLVTEASRGFVGRQTLLAKVQSFIEGEEDGYCFILARPGVGKTALLAQLVAGQPDYARHFNLLSEGICTTELFLNNVCAQLIGAYHLDPDLFPRYGSATTDLLLRLLEQSVAKAHGDRVVVVIDALDETTNEGRLPGVNPLSLPDSLPEGCRFIVTTRLETDGREPEAPLGNRQRSPLVIKEGGKNNQDDALTYVRSRLAKPESGTARDFADELVRRSEGYFVYLRHVLDQYDAEGELTLEDVTKLPVGLIPYYEKQFKRMRADSPEHEWNRVHFPVLTALATARRPLTYDELRVAARLKQRDLTSVVSAIRQWRQYLVGSPGSPGGTRAYRLFHESFREFLRTREGAAEIAEAQSARRAAQRKSAEDRYGPGRSRFRRPRGGADD